MRLDLRVSYFGCDFADDQRKHVSQDLSDTTVRRFLLTLRRGAQYNDPLKAQDLLERNSH